MKCSDLLAIIQRILVIFISNKSEWIPYGSPVSRQGNIFVINWFVCKPKIFVVSFLGIWLQMFWSTITVDHLSRSSRSFENNACQEPASKLRKLKNLTLMRWVGRVKIVSDAGGWSGTSDPPILLQSVWCTVWQYYQTVQYCRPFPSTVPNPQYIT